MKTRTFFGCILSRLENLWHMGSRERHFTRMINVQLQTINDLHHICCFACVPGQPMDQSAVMMACNSH